jgi:hypothetical protein
LVLRTLAKTRSVAIKRATIGTTRFAGLDRAEAALAGKRLTICHEVAMHEGR